MWFRNTKMFFRFQHAIASTVIVVISPCEAKQWSALAIDALPYTFFDSWEFGDDDNRDTAFVRDDAESFNSLVTVPIIALWAWEKVPGYMVDQQFVGSSSHPRDTLLKRPWTVSTGYNVGRAVLWR